MNLIDLIERIYSDFRYRYNNPLLKKLKYYSAMRFFIRKVSNIILPLYFYFTRGNEMYSIGKSFDKSPRIIVSFTSFPRRIDKIWLVVETILRQSIKPDILILWLSKEQFPTIDSLPKSLLKMRSRGLFIRFVDGDIRSHKKYYYVFKEYPKDVIITLDDDIYYPSNVIKTLMDAHEREPNVIFGRYGYTIRWKDLNTLYPYACWEKASKILSPSFLVFFGSGGGTLFPPGSLYKDVGNMELSQRLCPHADDVFLNVMARLKKTKIGIVLNNFVLLTIHIPGNTVLAELNLNNHANDTQIEDIRAYYKMMLNVDVFKEDYGKEVS